LPIFAPWEGLNADPALRSFLQRLIFVEQPFHRDIALSPEVGAALLAWRERPPIIIDESDGELSSAPTALENGYVGASHKNCKGIFKGIANTCLIRHRQRQQPDALHIISAEDLCNLGPVALLEDLAVLATLGIEHAERNGHHYFAGLSMLPDDVQALAPLALPHRCIVRSDAALRGRTAEQIISELLEETALNLGDETEDWAEAPVTERQE